MSRKKPNDRPFAYHTELELEITTLTNLGSGLGRVALPGETEAKWVVMVPFALPGERVRARIYRNEKNFSNADLVEILRAAPERIAPPCPLFGRCGGCQYQHFGYTHQLAWKRRQVTELLQHLAGIEFTVEPVQASPREYAYRSKITPHFAAPGERENFPIGFLRQGTRFEIIDVPACPIATEAINQALPAVREATRARAQANEFPRGATILLRDAGGVVVTVPETVVTERVGNLQLQFLARDFFQNNPFILPAFTEYVCAQAAATGAKFLVDAYCGSGLFALSAASRFQAVAGVEVSVSSVTFAEANARANELTNVRFLAANAPEIFAKLDFPPPETVVVIDPPRQGCGEDFLRQLFAFRPRAVIYVSCDPATQMRDLGHFLRAGFTLQRVQPFDLFPQTRHLECVMTLVAGN